MRIENLFTRPDPTREKWKVVDPTRQDLWHFETSWPDQRDMREALDTSFIAQFATCKEILPKFDSVNFKWFRQKTKGWKWHFCDAPLNLTVLHLKFNLVFGQHVQTTWEPAFFHSFKGKLWSLLYFFKPLYRSYMTETNWKKHKLKRQAFRLLVGAWSTSCPKITPKYVQLSGAWPIHLSGSDWTAQVVERKTTALSSF